MTVASPDCTAHAATTQSAARFLSTPRVLSNGFQRTLDHIRSVDYSEAYKCSLFERLMKMYFINDPLYRERFSNVRLWAEWAGHEPGFDGADTDIDLVAEERQGGYCAIQCKCYAPGTRTSKSPLDLSTARIVADTGDGWRTNAVKTIAPLRPTCDMLRFGDLASQRRSFFESLHKGTVSQQSGPGRAFKGLGVAKRYCSFDLIGDRFSQCVECTSSARMGHFGFQVKRQSEPMLIGLV